MQPYSSRFRLVAALARLRSVLFGDADRHVQIQGRRIDLRKIESVMERLSSVRECAVAPRESEAGTMELVAYILPSQAIDNPGTEAIHVTDDMARPVNGSARSEIPEHEIREWLDQTEARIRALKPARVLEIGCGTGSLLFRVAPTCAEYVATDSTSSALESIERNLPADWGRAPRIGLRQQAADDFSGIATGSFDLVVINLVAQEFPNIQYLVKVLEKAVAATREGGAVFVGDVPHLSPREEEARAFCRKGRTPQSTLGERELRVDPAFFDALARRTLGISHVEVLLKRGHHAHILPRSRYDVLLHVGEEAPEEVPVVWRRWLPETLSLASLRDLSGTPDEIFAFQGVPNKRLCTDGVDPEAFWSFAEEAGFEADITWSASGERGSYDVVLRQGRMTQARAARAVSDPMPWDAYANLPARSGTRNALIAQWHEHSRQKLPEYMAPVEFIVVESLPRTASGGIDRRKLRLRGAVEQRSDSAGAIFPAAFEGPVRNWDGTRMAI